MNMGISKRRGSFSRGSPEISVRAFAVLAVAFAGGMVASLRGAQAVKVAPQVLIVDAKAKGAELVLVNNGTGPAEVMVDLRFGYEVSDEEGAISTSYPTKGDIVRRSAVPWLRAYPRKVRLNPGAQQVVRLMVRPPDAKAKAPSDGEYWARAVVRAEPVLPPKKGEVDKVSMQIGVTTEQIIPIFVRRGEVKASNKIAKVTPKWVGTGADRSLEVAYWAAVEGTGAFLGQTKATIVTANDRVVSEATKPLAVFESGWRKISLKVPESEGTGELKLRLETSRTHPAIEAKDIVPGAADMWQQALAKGG